MNAVEPNNLKSTVHNFRDAALITTAKTDLQLPAEKQIDHLLSLTRLLLQNQRAELQRSRLDLAERSFIFKAAATMPIDSLRFPLAALSEPCKGHQYHSQNRVKPSGSFRLFPDIPACLRLNQKIIFLKKTSPLQATNTRTVKPSQT